MVKSAVDLLATNKKFKDGVLTGMLLAKKIAKDKKYAKTSGKKLHGGFSFKKMLAVAAGPIGWAWLAKQKGKEEKEKEFQKALEEYTTPSSVTPSSNTPDRKSVV